VRSPVIVSSFRNCENVKVNHFDVSGIAETWKCQREVIVLFHLSAFSFQLSALLCYGEDIAGANLNDAAIRLQRKVSRLVFLQNESFNGEESAGFRPKSNLNPVAYRERS